MKPSHWLAAWLAVAAIGGLMLVIDGPAPVSAKDEGAKQPANGTQTKSAAYEWLDIALEATAREHERVAPRPTVGSRMLAIIVTCMYDAWAAYDDKAVGTRWGDKLRRPISERLPWRSTT